MTNLPHDAWQELAELYGSKSDEELEELREDFDDLTDEAQGVLRDEMRRRGTWEKKPAVAAVTDSDPDATALAAAEDAANREPEEMGEFEEQGEAELGDFVAPVCPKCGSADVVLEGVEPTNQWKCGNCGNLWSDPVMQAK